MQADRAKGEREGGGEGLLKVKDDWSFFFFFYVKERGGSKFLISLSQEDLHSDTDLDGQKLACRGVLLLSPSLSLKKVGVSSCLDTARCTW